MKKFFALILILAMALSTTACAGVSSTAAASDEVVYTGEFIITKLEPYHTVPTGWSYLMCAKCGDVGVLLTVTPDVHLKYEISDTISGEVKSSGLGYSFKFDDTEWLDTVATIGLNDR